jgi:nucleotide-binding universal stress UspA family protein
VYEKILCPVDGSNVSNHGLREAVRLAAAMNSTLFLLHVVDNSAFIVFPPEVEALSDYMHEEGNKILKKALQVAGKKGVNAQAETIEIRQGRVAAAIVAAAKKAKVDLIVMGTQGRRGLSGLLLGSDAAAVVSAGSVPVLLVK